MTTEQESPESTEELSALINPEEYTLLRKTAWQRLRGPIGAFILFLIILGLWIMAVETGAVHRVILPPPIDVWDAFIASLSEGFFWEHFWVTLQEVLLGFAIGVLIGFFLGALFGISALAREVSYAYIVAFQGLPKIVLAPVFITAFGFGMMSKVVMAVVISFFPLLINTMSGLMTVDADSLQLMRSLTAKRRDVFFKLSIPHALPSIFAGVKTSLTLALVGAIVGEFVGASEGLGYLLHAYSYQLQVGRVWAITIVLAIMGILLYVIIEYADRKIVFWSSGGISTEAGM
jgi:NitT/TauT family transport system permease protein